LILHRVFRHRLPIAIGINNIRFGTCLKNRAHESFQSLQGNQVASSLCNEYTSAFFRNRVRKVCRQVGNLPHVELAVVKKGTWVMSSNRWLAVFCLLILVSVSRGKQPVPTDSGLVIELVAKEPDIV